MSDESWPISEEILSAAGPVGLLSEGHKNLGFVLSRIQSRFVVHSRVFKTLFTWSGGPRSSGVGFFCFVSPRA